LKQGNFNAANDTARQALQINRDSLAAYQILAEATEKQNRAETVVWRTQIARLQPRDIDSQLNLASAALRFGQLDAARKALDSVPKENRESAPYHVVAGWLARAQGDEAARNAISPQLWKKSRATKRINTTLPPFGSNRPMRRKTRRRAKPWSSSPKALRFAPDLFALY
jgi:tetratricopeptide (TPR) repeat protein